MSSSRYNRRDSGSSSSSESLISLMQGAFPMCSKITIEPILFVFFFASTMTSVININTLLLRTCSVTFNYTHDQCTGERDPLIERDLQVYTSNLWMGMSIIQSIGGVVSALFVGPWMDLNGRKLCLLTPLIGYFLYFLTWLALTVQPNIAPMYFMVASIFPMMSGGLTLLFAASFSYLNDITSESNRGFRMTMASLSIIFGILLGHLLQPFLQWFIPLSFVTASYLIAIFAIAIVITYVAYCVHETVTFIEYDGEKEKLVTLYHLKEMLRAISTRRPAHGRLISFVVCFIISVEVTVLLGDSDFRFLILKKTLGWTMQDYNFYAAELCASKLVASFVIMWLLNKVLGFRVIMIALFVSCGCFMSSVCLGLSKTSLDFYLAGTLGLLDTLLSPCLKAEISGIFPTQDSGKIFALLSIIESLTPFAASSCYTALYDHIVGYKPQALYFLSAGLWFSILLGTILILIIQGLVGRNYNPLDPDDGVGNPTEESERKDM